MQFFFFGNIFPNPKQKIQVPGYMLKIFPQSAKSCISFCNLKALCEQTSWLTHVATDHDVIDLLSCNAILGHFQTSSFYSTVVDRAWFFTSNKIKLPKCYVFSYANTLFFSHENNGGVQISRIRYHFFTDSGSKEKNCLEHRTMKKTKERLCEIYQNLLKPSW